MSAFNGLAPAKSQLSALLEAKTLYFKRIDKMICNECINGGGNNIASLE